MLPFSGWGQTADSGHVCTAPGAPRHGSSGDAGISLIRNGWPKTPTDLRTVEQVRLCGTRSYQHAARFTGSGPTP